MRPKCFRHESQPLKAHKLRCVFLQGQLLNSFYITKFMQKYFPSEFTQATEPLYFTLNLQYYSANNLKLFYLVFHFIFQLRCLKNLL